MKPSKGGSEGNEDGNPHIDPDTILNMWRESVPQAARHSWYVVDPWPEDAVIVSDWFDVSPTPDDVHLEYVPGLTHQRAATLASAADQQLGSSAANEIRTADSAEVGAPNSVRTARNPKTASSDNKVEVVQAQSSEGLTIEVFRERFSDGSLKVERDVTLDADFNYINHGMYRRWNESGKLIAEGRFDLGRRVDQWTREFARNESKIFAYMPFKLFKEPFTSTANFREGLLHGKWTIEDEEGRIVSEIEYVNGARHGQMTRFYPDGSKMREINFRNGYVDGLYREFNEKGELVVERKYIDGHYVSVKVEEFVSTTRKAETSYLSPRMTIVSTDDWWNAQLCKYGVEKGELVRHGPQAAWHESGKQRFVGEFNRGKAIGEFKWWHENGQLSRVGTYVDGKQNGVWTWWHTDGSKAIHGTYDHGRRMGRWLFWKPGGQLEVSRDLGTNGVPAARDSSEDVQGADGVPDTTPRALDAA
ncbi:MAG: hypothetical protein IH991_25975, partial [Planctomycetes bacterium]|nr:hypothetical protein [Planctomycetota bacterium]